MNQGSGNDEIKVKTNVTSLFENAKQKQTFLKICAPMVRYSKLEFRTLVRKYGVDLCFTPMIMADSFCRSEKARVNEFTTNCNDSPVIAQFAAQSTVDYLSATEMIYPYVDGVDLNCGCPQRWAITSGYGCALLNDPELVRDLTSTIRRNFPTDFSVSVKIRIQKPLDVTVNLVRQMEKCGITFVTVHGRTPTQKIGTPSNVDYLAEVKKSISIPMVANGDVRTLEGAHELYETTNCDGLMAARAILSNPTLFAGTNATPISCVQDWIDITNASPNITFQAFQHHLTFMLEKRLRRSLRVEFNEFSDKDQVLDFLEHHYGVTPSKLDIGGPVVCQYDEHNYRERCKENDLKTERIEYYSGNSKGKFFESQIDKVNGSDCDDNGLDFMDMNIFET